MTEFQMSADTDIDESNEALESGDRARALSLLLPLADAGNARAQYGLGLLYSIGDEHEFDKNEAIRWHEAALAQGMPFAAYALGNLFNPDVKRVWDHFNVPPFDPVKSAELYKMAAEGLAPLAEQGNVNAAAILGELYLVGFGVEANAEAMAYWNVLAFENGGYEAANALFSLYSGGYFPDCYDEEKSVYWFRKMREHQCQRLVDYRWENEMVKKGLLHESERSRPH